MTQKTLVERIASLFGIKGIDFAEKLRQAEFELQRIQRELEDRIIERLRGGGSYDLTDGLMSDAEIRSKVQDYFLSAGNYELPRIKGYALQI